MQPFSSLVLGVEGDPLPTVWARESLRGGLLSHQFGPEGASEVAFHTLVSTDFHYLSQIVKPRLACS